MDKLFIKSTYTTPQVVFDAEKGLFEIEGRIIPEDAESFFDEIFKWLDVCTFDNQRLLLVSFRIFYYNTGSSRCIVDVMKRFDALFQKGNNIKIEWKYEEGDEDAKRDGENFKTLLKVPFEVVKV